MKNFSLATFDHSSFDLPEHSQLAPLKTALHIIRSADADLDGALSFAEATSSYQLSWDEYSFINTHAGGGATPGLEAPALSAMLATIVETLRGKPWADRHSFFGADVAAAAAVKMLSRCNRAQIRLEEARVLGVSSAGFGWADFDGDGALSVEELVLVLKKVTAGGAAHLVDSPEASIAAVFGMPGARELEQRWLVLPDWHYPLPYNSSPTAEWNTCTHSDERLEELFRHDFARARLSPKVRHGSGGSSGGGEGLVHGAGLGSLVPGLEGGSSSAAGSAGWVQGGGGEAQIDAREVEGSGSGHGSGGGEAEGDPTLVAPLQFAFAFSHEMPARGGAPARRYVQYCGGTLIHPRWVVTAAGCLANASAAAVVGEHTVVLGGHDCVNGQVEKSSRRRVVREQERACAAEAARVGVSRVVAHPLYAVDPRYDVALLELERDVLGFEPARLDDGADLGFPACAQPSLTAVGWWSGDSNALEGVTAIRQQPLEFVTTEECRQSHLDTYGFHDIPDARLSICARSRAASASCQARGYFGQDGGALLLKNSAKTHKQAGPRPGGMESYVLVGIVRAGQGAGAGGHGAGEFLCGVWILHGIAHSAWRGPIEETARADAKRVKSNRKWCPN